MRLTINLLSIFFIFFFLFLNLQTLSIAGWMGAEEESMVKLYHFFALLFIPCTLLRINQGFPKTPSYILHYFAGITVISLLLFIIYPFNRILINHLFAFYTFYIGYYIATAFRKEQIILILQKVALGVFIIIIGKLLFHLPQIKTFMKSPDGHPDIYTIYGGGVNLEATWIGLNTALFINRKRLFYILLSISLLVSILYASRVGVVIALLVAGFKFISASTSRKERQTIIILGLLAALTFFLVIDLENLTNKLYALKRFAEFGGTTDKGMAGRYAIWRYYGTALWDSKLLGYGAGNGMYAIESISNSDYLEDNLHNLYLQILLEFGVIGLTLYLISVYNISVKALKSHLSNPLAIIILVYFIASLIQFRGTDALIWLYIGLFLKFETRKEKLAINEY